jgi:hypothetical protein
MDGQFQPTSIRKRRAWTKGFFRDRCQQLYEQTVQAHFPFTRSYLLDVLPHDAKGEMVEGFPAYVTHDGYLSPIGLRFKAPTLCYTASSPKRRPNCLLCGGKGMECGLHLIDGCPRACLITPGRIWMTS